MTKWLKTGLISAAVILFSGIQLQGQDIVINEFMSDNESTLTDEEGDFSDWIELYNRSEKAVNLEGYSLSDSKRDLRKWIFPAVTLPGKAYLLIYASGKDRYDADGLHTNFRISAMGDELYLSDADSIIDYIKPVKLKEDEVYLRFPDGRLSWLISADPTPTSSNVAFNQLVFSAKQGFHSTPFYLKIQSMSEDTVYYSLDCSAPMPYSCAFPDSLFLGYKDTVPNYYSEFVTTAPELDLELRAWKSPKSTLDKAHVIRCASFNKGLRTSYIYTLTYFVDKTIHSKYSMPVVSLVTEEQNLFSYDSGIYVPGIKFDPDNPLWTGNYFETGEKWEKPVHIEYFDSKGGLGFSQDAGLRIHGGKSREYAQKSLRLYARDEYGKSCFNYPLLPQKSHNKYKRFILRTTMSAWSGNTIISDAYAQNIASGMNIDYQDYQPVIVYLNGEYWGIHTIRDRIDERFIAYAHACDKDSVNIIGGNYKIVQAGSNKSYLELAEFIEHNDLRLEANFEYVKSKIDIDNFIDYHIAEMFFSNLDWPRNNQKLWQSQLSSSRWRWILFDLDAGFGDFSKNMIRRSLDDESGYSWKEQPVSSYLFDNMLRNESFRNQFFNRYAEILNTTFSLNEMDRKLNDMKTKYEAEIPEHIRRWGFPESVSEWEEDISENILTFIQERPCVVEKNVTDYFDLTTFNFSCIKYTDISDSLLLAPNPGNGNFYIYNNSSQTFLGNLVVTNVSGTTTYIEDFLYLEQWERKYFNMTGLPNGIYYLKFHSSTHFGHKTLLILN